MAMENNLTLWGVGTSRTMRPHWMLLELGLDYEFHPIQPRTGATMRAEFMRLNPRHKIPVLRHGSFIITESAAIVQYLNEIFTGRGDLYAPVDAEGRAALSELCYFVMTELDAASLYIVRRHLDLKQIYGDAPIAVESARKYFAHNIEAMADRIGERSPYLFGERFSTADILLMTCLDWARYCEIALPKPVAEYQHRTSLRPAYQAAMKRNFANISR
jgi:glutathione S-transferase